VEFPLLSERLLLRPFERSDAPAVHEVYRDELVMRWVGTGPVTRPEQTVAMLSGYIEHQRKHGFSFWAVIQRDSGDLLGDAGLYRRGERVELGYTLGRSHWGMGYGTEAAGVCVRAAFEKLGIDQLEAFVRPENGASAAVLGKLGFEARDRVYVHGAPHVRFVLPRDTSAGRTAG
jgi:ribosomal-protein-alanine N-acetyltransferase